MVWELCGRRGGYTWQRYHELSRSLRIEEHFLFRELIKWQWAEEGLWAGIQTGRVYMPQEDP